MFSDLPFKINHWLAPLSFFYGMGVRLRNLLFDWGVLRSETYDIPVLCVGNLTAGGTGKTPHTELVIRLLKHSYKVAVLSRGYRRKTKGYVLATPESTYADIGDEPVQIKQKFPDIIVAVDEDRRRGIKSLLALPENERPEVILLDDGFQHRYVSPSFTILLTNFNRMFYDDKLLPAGRLREPANAILKADMVIITKCRKEMKPIEYRIIEEHMNLLAHQEVFFTRVSYQEITPLFPSFAHRRVKRDIRKDDDVLILSGIAYPEGLVGELRKYSAKVKALSFPDHHDFTAKDMEKANTAFKEMQSAEKLIITTEKDASRLIGNPHVPEEWKTRLYVQPVKVEFHNNKEGLFENMIRKHIKEKQNRGIYD